MLEYEYRAYFIGLDGHFINAKIIPSRDDESAIAATKQFIDGQAIELWHGNRKVAAFDAKQEGVARVRPDYAQFQSR